MTYIIWNIQEKYNKIKLQLHQQYATDNKKA